MNILGAILLALGFLARMQVHGIPALWLAAVAVACLALGFLLLAAGQLVRDARRVTA